MVYVSDVVEEHDGQHLATYIADRAPLFYRTLQEIVESLKDGYFLSTFRETLARLPSSTSFRESHFAEIAACIFAEEVMGLRKLYSKLSLLTAENANAFKMDLLLYKPGTNPVEFVFAEVKSSPKTLAEGLPSGHDNSCFPALFDSFNQYDENDLSFDLNAAKDRLEVLDASERTVVREALKPYAERVISYAGFVIIDYSTKCDDETSILATRKNNKQFDVDLICIQSFPIVADSVYSQLEAAKKT